MATLKNTTINDTGFVRLPPGTTAQRPASPSIGMIRYNTTLGFSEQYTADGWQGIAPPPAITTVSPTVFNGESGTSITINGSNFDATATVAFILFGGAVVNATTTTRNSSSQLVATTGRDFLATESPASIRVTNGSGLASTLDNALTFADVPVWSTASGSLGTIYDSNRSGYTLSTLTATDANGGSVTYSITSGALPTGLSLNSSSGVISGTATQVGTDTTSSFTARATDNAGNTTDRAFSVTVRAPVATAFSYTGGYQTFTVPTNVNYLKIYAWGAAGGGNQNNGGNIGGSGGYSYGELSTSANTTYAIVVGGGGSGGGPTGAGGGLTGIFSGSSDVPFNSTGRSRALLIAGGGGGGSHGGGAGGGAGGGSSGNTGWTDNRAGNTAGASTRNGGRGGSQSAGGAVGNETGGPYGGNAGCSAGSDLLGGYGVYNGDTVAAGYGGGGGGGGSPNGSDGGAGGGGGYFGGGGGNDYWSNAAGGGSGYIGGVVNGVTTTGSDSTATSGTNNPPNTGSPYYSSGVGVGNGQSSGGSGRLVIVY